MQSQNQWYWVSHACALGIEIPTSPSIVWREGFLAGVFDAEGSYSRGVLRITNKDLSIIDTTVDSLTAIDVPCVVDPVRTNGVRSVRVTGGIPLHRRFFERVRPSITRKLDLTGVAVKTHADLRVVTIEDLGVDIDMVDITTGTQDFIANGVISHNCFARNTHTYLDLDAGRDFDSQIVVKVNVADVLRRELARPGWQRESVALGTNTDPYQRAEGRYRLMPGIIEALAESATPLSILTKGTLLRRDLPLLVDAKAHVPISIAMSIAVFDDALQASLEPGTPSATARLTTVRAATDAGFRVTVFLMPILPHLTDSVAALDHALARIREAGASRVVFGALHLRPGAKEWFWQWLERDHPDLVPAYRGLYPGVVSYAPDGYRKWLTARVRPLLRRHRLSGGAEEDVEARPSRPGPVRMTGRAAAQEGMLF
jgi:DNA repair photolyase